MQDRSAVRPLASELDANSAVNPLQSNSMDGTYVDDPSSHTILIVDDDSTNVALLETLLSQKGYKTMSAESGFKALELFAQAVPKPSCVLLDIGLPDISGT
jgi:PleD family two-component response regulator